MAFPALSVPDAVILMSFNSTGSQLSKEQMHWYYSFEFINSVLLSQQVLQFLSSKPTPTTLFLKPRPKGTFKSHICLVNLSLQCCTCKRLSVCQSVSLSVCLCLSLALCCLSPVSVCLSVCLSPSS